MRDKNKALTALLVTLVILAAVAIVMLAEAILCTADARMIGMC